MWIIYALVSAIADAGRNISNKRLTSFVTRDIVNPFSYLLSLPLYLVSLGLARPPLTWSATLMMLLAVHSVLEIMATTALTRALEIDELSFVAPLLGISGVLVAASSRVIVRESIGLAGTLAAGTVALGTYFVCSSKYRATACVENPAAIRILQGSAGRAATRLGLFVATIWALDAQVLRLALRELAWQYFLTISAAVVGVALLAYACREHGVKHTFRTVRLRPGAFMLVGTLAGGSLMFMMMSMDRPGALVAYVVSLKRLSIPLSAAAGIVVFSERMSVARVVGTVFILAGVLVITIIA